MRCALSVDRIAPVEVKRRISRCAVKMKGLCPKERTDDDLPHGAARSRRQAAQQVAAVHEHKGGRRVVVFEHRQVVVWLAAFARWEQSEFDCAARDVVLARTRQRELAARVDLEVVGGALVLEVVAEAREKQRERLQVGLRMKGNCGDERRSELRTVFYSKKHAPSAPPRAGRPSQ